MPSKKVIYTFAVLFLVVVGWLWWLGRSNREEATDLASRATITPVDLPPEFIINWSTRENQLEQIIAQKRRSGVKLKELTLSTELVAKYDAKDLKVTTAVAPSTLETYGKDIAAALLPYGEERENELAVIGKIYDSQDLSQIGKLSAIKNLHQTALTAFLGIKVPNDAVSLHLSIVNELSLMVTLLGYMEVINEEPVLALQSAQSYQLVLLSFYSDLGQINEYFRSRQVKFEPEDRINVFINTR